MCPSHGCPGKATKQFGQPKALDAARSEFETLVAKKGKIGLVYVFKHAYPACWDWTNDAQGVLLYDVGYQVFKSFSYREAVDFIQEEES
jgi:hypothetical protein